MLNMAYDQNVGCILTILYEDNIEESKLNWKEYISGSGIKEKYGENILSRRIYGKELRIVFDDKVNCFDMIQLVKDQYVAMKNQSSTTSTSYNKSYTTTMTRYGANVPQNGSGDSSKIILKGIKGIYFQQSNIKPTLVQVYPQEYSQYFNISKLEYYLKRFGLILHMEREKEDGINTGTINVLIVLDKEQELLKVNNEELTLRASFLHPKMFPLWDEEMVGKLHAEFIKHINNSTAQRPINTNTKYM